MPRPNPPREINAERNLARRVRLERDRRGWSYAGLAQRLTNAGCPINQTSLYKLEQSERPRRITVDELVALSRVFGTSVGNMLVDSSIAENERLVELVEEAEQCHSEWVLAEDSWVRAHAVLVSALDSFSGDTEKARALLEGYESPPSDVQGRAANRILMQSDEQADG